MVAVLRLASEGDLSRITKQELRKQSRVWRERPFGDHRDVPRFAVMLVEVIYVGRSVPGME